MNGPVIRTSNVDVWICSICKDPAVVKTGVVRPLGFCKLHLPAALSGVEVDYQLARDEAGLNDELYAHPPVLEPPFPDEEAS